MRDLDDLDIHFDNVQSGFAYTSKFKTKSNFVLNSISYEFFYIFLDYFFSCIFRIFFLFLYYIYFFFFRGLFSLLLRSEFFFFFYIVFFCFVYFFKSFKTKIYYYYLSSLYADL